MGKFMTVVCSHTAMISFPADLNSRVAIRLMDGHMRSTVTFILTRRHNAEGDFLGKAPIEEKVQDKSSRAHDDQLMEGHEEDRIGHSSNVERNVVADHGINHYKHHKNCKYQFL